MQRLVSALVVIGGVAAAGSTGRRRRQLTTQKPFSDPKLHITASGGHPVRLRRAFWGLLNERAERLKNNAA